MIVVSNFTYIRIMSSIIIPDIYDNVLYRKIILIKIMINVYDINRYTAALLLIITNTIMRTIRELSPAVHTTTYQQMHSTH